MIVVHHLEDSRSQRILWLLEELGVDYSVERHERNPKTKLAPTALKKVHPLGKSPVIDDDGVVVAESGAITEYLIEKYGSPAQLCEDDPERRRACRFWMHYAEGSVMPLLVMTLVFNTIDEAKKPFFVKPIAKAITGQVRSSFLDPQIKHHFDYIESQLGEAQYFLGDSPCAADFMMVFPLEAAASRVGLGDRLPNIRAWVARVHARPAYQRALERGGPYAYA